MTLQHTPPNAIHRSLGAHIADLGGWDMPVNYGSQVEKHYAVRQGAGIFDVSYVRVVGLTSVRMHDFPQGLLANNAGKLQTPGKALYGCMLNPEGGVADDLIVYFSRGDWFHLVVNADTAPTDLEWTVAQNAATGADATITPRHSDNNAGAELLGILAVQGPNARVKTYAALPGLQAVSDMLRPFNTGLITVENVGEIMVARTGYTGEDDFELVVSTTQIAGVWECLLQVGIHSAGLGARDTLRLEAGMNLYGQGMDEYVSPLDAGLARTADLRSKRDFTGRAAL